MAWMAPPQPQHAGLDPHVWVADAWTSAESGRASGNPGALPAHLWLDLAVCRLQRARARAYLAQPHANRALALAHMRLLDQRLDRALEELERLIWEAIERRLATGRS